MSDDSVCGGLSSRPTAIHIAKMNTDIHFSTKSQPDILVLCDDGSIKVRGKLVCNDMEVVDAMRAFLMLGPRRERIG